MSGQLPGTLRAVDGQRSLDPDQARVHGGRRGVGVGGRASHGRHGERGGWQRHSEGYVCGHARDVLAVPLQICYPTGIVALLSLRAYALVNIKCNLNNILYYTFSFLFVKYLVLVPSQEHCNLTILVSIYIMKTS